MSAASNTVDAVSAVGSSPSSSYDAMTQAQNAYQLQQLEVKSKEKTKSHGANHSHSGESPVEKDWNFSKEETHKLYQNMCNSFINQCKQDQDQMKQALNDLKQSTEIGG